MAVDTPATISILGAGPIGLEAALYARFLGYDVRVFERGRIAENVLRWGHVQMFTPMCMNTSSLGRAALHAQENATVCSALVSDTCPTGEQWVTQYLLPLAKSDLLVDCVFEYTEVVSVTLWDLWKGQKLGDSERGDSQFRILVRERDGRERAETADVVIDTTGVYSEPNWLGPGGGPAVGERGLGERIDYWIPDVLGADRGRFAGRRTLLVGSGYSAATTAVALAQLAGEIPGTSALWLTHSCNGEATRLSRIENDRLPLRDQLVQQSNQIMSGHNSAIEHRRDWLVNSVSSAGHRFEIELRHKETDETKTETADAIVANVGYHVNTSLFRELHVHQCYATEGPMQLAASMMKRSHSADCLDQECGGADTLKTTEEHFYILGAKSYGRRSDFLYGVGLMQIRDLFTLIGDRKNLDLYAGAEQLPQ